MIPGSNLLRRAAQLIRLQDITVRKWVSNSKTLGTVVPTYADPVTVKASVQAVSRAMYTLFGLDLQKNYLMVYCGEMLRDLERGVTCDQIDYDGRRYDVLSNTDWHAQDGWRGSLCIDVGAIPA